MRALLTEPEVADLAALDVRSVRRRACELLAQRAIEPVRNGRRPRVYLLRGLSPKLQDAYLAEQQTPPAPAEPGENRLELALTFPRGFNFSAEDEAEAKRRYGIIEPVLAPERFETLWLQNQRQKTKLIETLAQKHQIGKRTIYGWVKAWQDHGLPGLIRKDRDDKGFSRRLNRAALDFIVAAALPLPKVYGELSVREIYRAYKEEQVWRETHATKKLEAWGLKVYARYVDLQTGCLSASAQLPDASYETFRFWYNRIPEVVKTFAREGEESFHNSQEILSFRSFAEIQPLDYLVMDHRQLDIFCMVRSGDGWKLIRPWLTAALDMRTRKWLAWVIVETPSSDSIASVLKRVFLKWGTPLSVYWDNGKDFTCQWLEGKHTRTTSAARIAQLEDGVRGALDTLGIRVHHAIVRRARSKIIEPNFGNVANYDRTLPWWCGHKPTARPERFDALVDEHGRWLRGEVENPPFLTIEQVAGLYDAFLESLNEREHSGGGMQKITPTGHGWMCPNEAWELLIPKVELRTVPAEVLGFCFAKRKKLTVRHGELCVTFGRRQYHYRMPGSSNELIELNGREVDFAYDPLDLGTAAVYFEERFRGLAVSIELRRMGENDFVQDERDRRANRRDVKRIISAVHQQVHVPGAIERAARRAAVQPARVEPERPAAQVDVPAPIIEAARAKREDEAFSFAGAEAGARLITDAHARPDDQDDEFQFFGGTK